MNDLVKRKKEIEEELDEILEMDSDLVNVKTDMTISVVGNLLKKLIEHFNEMSEIAESKKYYDENLGTSIQSIISEIKTAFSQIQPPTINVAPQVKFDLSVLQPVLSKLGDQNSTLINLVSKYNNNQSEPLLKLIISYIEKLTSFLDKDVKNFDYTNNIKGLENAINNRPTEFKSSVTKYDDRTNRIEEITTKVIK